MSIELTEQQQQALDAEAETPPRVIDPRSNAAYYLVPAGDYEAVRELVEEERRQKQVEYFALGENPFLRGVKKFLKSATVSSRRDGSFTVVALPGPGLVAATLTQSTAWLIVLMVSCWRPVVGTIPPKCGIPRRAKN